MSITAIVLIVLVILYVTIGFGIVFLLTRSGGEKLKFDKQTLIFIFGWPFVFILMGGR